MIYVKINGEKWEVRGSGLHIRYVDISNINEIEGLQNIENLKELSIIGTNIRTLDGLEHLQDLEMVWFAENKIEDLFSI